jgi:hypothetical protein
MQEKQSVKTYFALTSDKTGKAASNSLKSELSCLMLKTGFTFYCVHYAFNRLNFIKENKH